MQEQDYELPLYLRAREYLLDRIRRMNPGDNQLEPENLLTTKLGMSRETVRKAMTTLIQEGSITRKHGKGNFGHPAVTNLAMRIDINSDFRRILTSQGYSVRSFRSEARVSSPSVGMLRRIPEVAGSRVVEFDLDFIADGRPAIHSSVELLKDIVVSVPPPGEYKENINAFLKEYCTTESNYTTAWLFAENKADEAARFGLDPSAALLCWEEVYYNIYDLKMGYVKIYFNSAIMDMSLLLKF
jgi:GntR family transcriptional regulator